MNKKIEKYFWLIYSLLFLLIFIFSLTGYSDISSYLFIFMIVLFILLVIEGVRENRNFFLFYLFDFPLFLFFIGLVYLWFYIPVFLYFSEENSLYYTWCIPLLGGYIGEIFWIVIYVFLWGIVGSKVYKLVEKVLINSSYLFNKIIQKFTK
jgi:hypothetical protein